MIRKLNQEPIFKEVDFTWLMASAGGLMRKQELEYEKEQEAQETFYKREK